MHPIIFAVVGFVGMMAVASALGYLFGFALIMADLIRDHPVAVAKAGVALAGCVFTFVLLISGDLLLGCLGVILLGLWLAISSGRRQ